jgi:manganese/zinc/iron transport system ATP- binding protein
MGLIATDTGHALVDGKPMRSARDHVAYVPQREEVDWDFPITVREVVEMGRYRSVGWIRRLRSSDHSLVDEALERVGMTPFAGRQIGQLSGGQRQRTFVARALAQQASLMLMDEPFSGIDARSEASILALLCELRDAGTSIVVVHHDLATVRAKFDWALVLNVRAVVCGPVSETLSHETLRRAYGDVGIEGADAQMEEELWAGL